MNGADQVNRPIASGTGNAKVIVLGEHAVVHGSPALAAAMTNGCEVKIEPWDGPSHVLLAEGAFECASNHPVATALGRALANVELPTPVRVTPHFSVPVGAGLGSSAAFAVALSRALASFCAPRTLDRGLVVQAVEGCFHGRPSGLDAYLAEQGGIGSFTRAEGFTPLRLPALNFVVINTGIQRETSTQVNRVSDLLTRFPNIVSPIFATIAEIVRDGIRFWQNNNLKDLGTCMNINQGLLDALGVSHPANQRAVELARASGALGAKLTGAGGGGCVLALTDCAETADRIANGFASGAAFATVLGEDK